MCGIFGTIGWTERADPDELRRMDRTLRHRGPDAGAAHVRAGVGLGMRRLSIVDPEHGHQPFTNDDGSVVVVCNGEIYNHRELRAELGGRHRFRSGCDVEVLPHLYEERGIDMLRDLNGQFAMAIHDLRRDVVYLARDGFGIAPLYYHGGERMRFASEVKALLPLAGVGRELDPRGLDQVLGLPSVVSPQTMFAGIRSVRPGHYLEIGAGGVDEHEYWDLVHPPEGEIPVEDAEVDHPARIADALHTAVRRRLMADAQVGLYVSGGLDSAFIASLAADLRPRNVTGVFSVGFPQAELDESPYQQSVAERVGRPHHHVRVGVDDICRRLERTVWHSETPMRESYNVASLMLAEAASAAGVRVVLSGEGADELFAGYSGYRFDEFRAETGGPEPGPEERAARETLWGDPEYGYDLDFAALRRTREELYSDGMRAGLHEFDFTRAPVVRADRMVGRHRMHQRSYLDVKLRMSDHLLGDHGDRMTMASSVEGRFPFLDRDVVETALAVPPSLKLHDYQDKYVLKQAARGWVPRSVVEREKFPFTAPSSPYLVQQAPDFVRDWLAPDTLRRQGLFDADRVRAMVDRYAAEDYRAATPLRTDWLMLVLTTTMLADMAGRSGDTAPDRSLQVTHVA